MNQKMKISQPAVVFYDGHCGLCQWSIRYLLKVDKERFFRFSSLQSGFAKEVLSNEMLASYDTLVVTIDEEQYTKGRALLIIGKKLSLFWYPMIKILPIWLIDFGYNFIAKLRYKIFGRSKVCHIPTNEEKNLFID